MTIFRSELERRNDVTQKTHSAKVLRVFLVDVAWKAGIDQELALGIRCGHVAFRVVSAYADPVWAKRYVYLWHRDRMRTVRPLEYE